MKNLLVILLFLPVFLFGQIQVSTIDYQLPRDDYGRKGFMSVDGEEYFIEQGYEGTQVSRVLENELEFLHEIKIRPTDSQLNIYTYSYENSNSGLIYNGTTLYELYWEHIYAVDVVTNELVDHIDLREYGIRLQTDFYHGENFYYFRALGVDWNGYVRIDRNSGELEMLPDEGVVVEGIRYWMSEDGDHITYHNLETNEIGELSYPFSLIESITRHLEDEASKLIIRDETGLHLLKNDDSVYSIPCSIPQNGNLKNLSNRRMAYTTNDGSNLDFIVVDLEDCSIAFSESHPVFSSEVDLYTYSDKQLFDEYFIFGFPNDWQGIGYFSLYNESTDKADVLELPSDFPSLSSAVRYEDGYYFLTYDHIHYLGSFPELYRIDLETVQIKRISDQEIYTTPSIVIGEQQENEKVSIYYGLNDSGILSSFSESEQTLTTLEQFDLYKNHGIYYSIYADVWLDNQYFFSTSSAIFVTENNVTTKVLDIGPNVHGSSAYKASGNHVYVLTGLGESHYALKINRFDLSYDTIPLPGVDYLYWERYSSENAIINMGSGSRSSKGFFDVNLETFISFEDLGLPDGIPTAVSGNNILYKTYSTGGDRWFLINTVNRSVRPTQLKSGTFPDPYPDGEGGFYLNGWSFDDEVNFMYLNESGNVTNLYKDFNHNVFYTGNQFSGDVKSLAFDAPDAMIIISVKNGETRMKSIDDNGMVYYQPFYWYESDQASYIQVYNGNNYDTYRFTFETDPVKITPNGREEQLVLVLEDDESAVLVYKDNYNALSFERFDYNLGSFDQILVIQSVRNRPVGEEIKKIGESKYLFELNDGIHGNEPYTFDMETESLELLKDMKEGFGSSNISDFTNNPLNGDLYFSAIKTENDRQLFKLENTLNTIEVEDISSELSIFPIPAVNEIRLEEDFDNISIMTIDGRIVYRSGAYLKESAIPIERLKSGMYIVKAKTSTNTRKVGKFLVQR